jgi:outer membrane protein
VKTSLGLSAFLAVLAASSFSQAQTNPVVPAPAVAPAGAVVVPAPAAPAAARPPAAATPAARAAGTLPPPTSSEAIGSTPLVGREAPAATNPVLAAFTPQEGGITADEVARRAVASSDTIEAKNADLRAAAAKVDAAFYQFLPKVTLKAGYTRMSRVENSMGGEGALLGAQSSTPPITARADGVVVDGEGNPVGPYQLSFPVHVDYYSLSASLAVPLSDYLLRLSDSVEATKQNRAAAELNILAERQKVEGDARIAFFNWAKSIGQVAVTEKSIERVRARLKDVEVAFTVGTATRVDVLRLQSLLATTEAGLEAGKAFRELAAEQLAIIMDDKTSTYALGEDVLAEPQARAVVPLADLIAEASQKRTELLSISHTIKSFESAEQVVRSGKLPRLDGFADYTFANPNQRYSFGEGWHGTWSAGLQLSWTVNELLTNDASAKELHAQRQSLEANRRSIKDGIRLEVTSAYTDGRRAVAALEAAKRASEASQAAYDTSLQLYKVGKATTAELIDAEAELVNSLLQMISAHIDTRLAETRLAKAIGRDLSTLSAK